MELVILHSNDTHGHLKPLPSPMPRRAGKFRNQLVVSATGRGPGQVAARILVQQAEQIPARGDLKWSIDVDPLDIF